LRRQHVAQFVDKLSRLAETLMGQDVAEAFLTQTKTAYLSPLVCQFG
jgi:hypothetical protein